MARKPTTTLTEGELKIMVEVWTLGEASVKSVAERLAQSEPVAYTTVQTMMRILEEKGVLTHRKDGRAFVYRPLVERDQARSSALRQLLDGFFEGNATVLVQSLIKDEAIDLMELDRLQRLVRGTEEN